ncbi:MAG: hypothetical protein ACLTQI_09305 [Slackia sp.]
MKTLFTNATFHTMESAEDTHCSMLVEDGVIAAFDLLQTIHMRRMRASLTCKARMSTQHRSTPTCTCSKP